MINRMLSSSSICDCDVKNTEGKNIGTIKDMMIDLAGGRIGYVVLSFGGFMGFGEKLFAIPLNQFSFGGADDEELILNVSKERLENAPGFDKDHWPRNPDAEFNNSVYRHYSVIPTPAEEV